MGKLTHLGDFTRRHTPVHVHNKEVKVAFSLTQDVTGKNSGLRRQKKKKKNKTGNRNLSTVEEKAPKIACKMNQNY